MVAPKNKKSVKGQGSGKPTFRAEKTVEVMDKKPVFEVFRRFGDGPETSVGKFYPDSLTNPTKFYDTDARLVYDFNSDLIHEVPGMAVDAVKQKITELNGSSPQAPAHATAKATPAANVPEQYKKPPRHVPQPSSPPPKPASPPTNYQAECEGLEAELEEKAEEIADLKSKLAAKKPAAGISQADLEKLLAKRIDEVSAAYKTCISNVHFEYYRIASGADAREHDGKVELKVYSKTKDKELWIHQRKDGRFAYSNKEGKDVIYMPEKIPVEDLQNYFAAAELAIGSQKNLKAKEKRVKALEKKLAKANQNLEDRVSDLPDTYEKSISPVQNIGTGTVATILSGITGYLVERGHLFENAIRNYIPSVSWLADYADQLHQIDPNNYAGIILGGLLGLAVAYNVLKSKRVQEQPAEEDIFVEVLEVGATKQEELPAVPLAPQPHKPATKVYKSRDSKAVDEEFE